jgi:hypothetical protein
LAFIRHDTRYNDILKQKERNTDFAW